MIQWVKLGVFLLGVTFLVSCAGAKGSTKDEKRAYVDNVRNETLARLYNEKPEAKSKIDKAVGHAVFSSINTNLFLFSSASGFGVASSGGKKTYMKMYQFGVGPGLGIKDYRAVFIFYNQVAYNTFIEKGWEFGGHADAAAKSGKKGGAAGGEAVVEGNIEIYTLTESGIALQATIAGTKYWKDDELN